MLGGAPDISLSCFDLQVFGRVVDPENFADQAYLTMNAWQVELADSRIGCLRLFSPDNPTGVCGGGGGGKAHGKAKGPGGQGKLSWQTARLDA